MRTKTIIACVLLIATRAAADPTPPATTECRTDPACHVKNGGTLTTPKGAVLTLPPGYYLDDGAWAKRDAELKAAQDQGTRLKAENESFRASAAELHWKTPAIAFGLGVVAGVAAVLYVK